MISRFITCMALAACVGLATLVTPSAAVSRPLAPAAPPAAPHRIASVSRPWAPVVVGPAQLPDLSGTPVSRLAVWVYRQNEWRLIPWQVDEQDAGGYTAEGDGLFNGQDELVVMLDDLGETAPGRPPGADIVSIVTVSDPLAPDEAAHVAYVARMTVPTAPPAVDYVQYDATTHRLRSGRYVIGLNARHPTLDYLALNGSSLNLIDRLKLRAVLNDCGLTCSAFTEEQLPIPPLTPLKDGPVRVVLSRAGSLAYRDWVWLPVELDFTGLPVRLIQVHVHLDLATGLEGARYRDANVPQGVVVDGVPDDVPSVPFSPWREIDHPTGRLVTTYHVQTGYGDLFNFYQEGMTIVSEDTGDKRAWGDHGIAIDEPVGTRIAVDTALWALPPDTALAGPGLTLQQTTPLRVAVSRPQFPSLYLPLLRRSE